MARQRRLDIPNGIYHVITRGIDGKNIFRKTVDKQEFIICLRDVLEEDQGQCYAWALMDNHIHLCIRTGDESLANMMRKILTKYAIYFNKRYKRHGYLFQNRYKSILCQEESYLQELVRYIHLNPVRAGLISSAEELDKYAWTGHSAVVGEKERKWQHTNDILLRYSENRKLAIEKYKEFIKDGWEKPSAVDDNKNPKRKTGQWKMIRNCEKWRGEEMIRGDDRFVAAVIEKAEEMLDRKERAKRKWTVDRLIATVCLHMGIRESELLDQSRVRRISDTRSVIAYIGCCKIGLNGAELARRLGVSRPAISLAQKKGKRIVEEKKIYLIS